MPESIRRMPFPVVLAFAAGVVFTALVAFVLTASGAPAPSASPIAQGSAAPGSTASPSVGTSPTESPAATATPAPTPSPVPTPVTVPAPLTGRLVSPEVALRHPIAVMVDDLDAARPQSGFSAASVVWQAPAEGGIPRYMMIFQDKIPKSVGPVRSSRYYYIAWAAEWKAVYAHVGGSPQAIATLAAQGNGQLVYNADQFRWGGSYFHRITQRNSPHNVYTEGSTLWKLAKRLGAKNVAMKAVWRFAPDAPLEARPKGGTIQTAYPRNAIKYTYDRNSNTYLRSVTGEPKETDAATGERVAPKNVVIMWMSFGPLNDGHPNKHRLEATVVGSGKAWIATNGKTIVGTWRKKSLTGPTQFFDKAGKAVTLTVGQTFVQVMKVGTIVTVKDGTVPPPTATPSPSASPSPAG